LTGEICGWIVDNYGPYASSVSDIATGVLYVVGSYHLACMGAGGTALGAFDTGITMMSVGVINIFATASGNPTFPESTVPTLTATYLFGEDVADYVSLAENLVLGRYVFWVREKKNADTLEITYEILQLIDGIWEIVTESDDPYLLDPYAAGIDPWGGFPGGGGGSFGGYGATGTWEEQGEWWEAQGGQYEYKGGDLVYDSEKQEYIELEEDH